LKAILILVAALGLIAAIVLVGLRLVKAVRLWPAALLVMTAPLEVYRSSSGAGANVSLFRLALLVAIGALCIDLARGRMRFPRALAVPLVIYGGLVLWQLISLFTVTSNPSLAHRFIGQYVAGLAAAFVITCYVERKDLRIIGPLFAAAAVLPLVAGAYRVFSVSRGGGGDLPGLTELPLDLAIEAARQSGSFLLDGTQRLNATFTDPNLFGFYIATVFILSVALTCRALFADKPVRWRAAVSYVLLMVSAAVALAGTYSRSAWLLAAAGVTALAVLLGREFWSRTRVIAGCVGAVAALGLASPFIISRLESSEPGNAKSTQVHEHAVNIALELVARHPLVGVGLGGYGRYAGEPAIISSAVSTYLTVAAELGLPGLILLLGAIVTTLVAAVRTVVVSTGGDRMLLAGLVAAFAGLALANTIYEAWMDDFQWVLFGLVLALTTQPQLALRAVFRRHGERAPADAAKSGSGRGEATA
jgi:O-Antigen ligase